MTLTRREMLKLGLAGSAALALPIQRVVGAATAPAGRIAESSLPKPFTIPFATPPVLTPVRTDATTDYYSIVQQQSTAQILPGIATPVWGYNGIVPGPTIDVMQGREVVVNNTNSLPSAHPSAGFVPWTSTHLHGSASLPQFDGYAADISQPGQWKQYRYPNFQNARTLWYHDHGVHHTAENVFMGLAAMYRLHDPVASALPIPQGRYDVPLIIQDAMFATDGSLLYDDDFDSSVMGDVILVNGRPWPVMAVERRKYRFRILVASVSRSFRLALDSGDPLTVIATDGGLMPAPQPVTQLRAGMAERYEVVIDFAKYPVGRRVVLRNLRQKNNIDYANTDKVMAFDVVAPSSSTANNAVPSVLDPANPVMLLDPAQAVAQRTMRLKRKNDRWTINGEVWQDVIDSGFTKVFANPKLNDVEVWTIQNTSGGWFHPLHIHLVDFKILDRNGRPPRPEERGPKDVVYVGEDETVRVIARFGPHPGRYMVHCHNLVHEDHDMMTQFEVGSGGDDPIASAPPQWGTAPPP
jgi:spore coat protein A, manganese oxidase